MTIDEILGEPLWFLDDFELVDYKINFIKIKLKTTIPAKHTMRLVENSKLYLDDLLELQTDTECDDAGLAEQLANVAELYGRILALDKSLNIWLSE